MSESLKASVYRPTLPAHPQFGNPIVLHRIEDPQNDTVICQGNQDEPKRKKHLRFVEAYFSKNFRSSVETCTRLFQIEEYGFDEKLNVVCLVCLSIIFIVAALFVIFYSVISYAPDFVSDLQSGTFNTIWIDIIVTCFTLTLIVVNLVIFCWIKNVQIMVFTLNVAIVFVILYYHFWTCKKIGLAEGSPICGIFFVICCAAMFGSISQLIFWSVFSFLFLITTYTKDMAHGSSERIANYYSEFGDRIMYNNYTFWYFTMITDLILMLLPFAIAAYRRNRMNMTIRGIFEAIEDLDFDNEMIKELESKNVKYASGMEKLLKLMIQKMKMLKDNRKSNPQDVPENRIEIDPGNVREEEPVIVEVCRYKVEIEAEKKEEVELELEDV